MILRIDLFHTGDKEFRPTESRAGNASSWKLYFRSDLALRIDPPDFACTCFRRVEGLASVLIYTNAFERSTVLATGATMSESWRILLPITLRTVIGHPQAAFLILAMAIRYAFLSREEGVTFRDRDMTGLGIVRISHYTLRR